MKKQRIACTCQAIVGHPAKKRISLKDEKLQLKFTCVTTKISTAIESNFGKYFLGNVRYWAKKEQKILLILVKIACVGDEHSKESQEFVITNCD